MQEREGRERLGLGDEPTIGGKWCQMKESYHAVSETILGVKSKEKAPQGLDQPKNHRLHKKKDKGAEEQDKSNKI